MNILFVGAHHDDLELSIGGSIAKWSREHNIYSAILTTSEWNTPEGKTMCPSPQSLSECDSASKTLGYTPINLMLADDFKLEFKDEHVVEVLKIIEDKSINMLITIWPYDAHPTHRVVSQIAMAASRRVPKILTTRGSWNSVPESFNPSYFVDISCTFEVKKKALRCYEAEFARRGDEWNRYITATGTMYGLEANCPLAEGFEIVRYLE